MRQILFGAAAFTALCLAGCGETADVKVLRAQVAQAQADEKKLNQKADEMQARIDDLEARVEDLEFGGED